MYSPGKRLCDLCQTAEIGGDDPYPVFFYPLTRQQRDQLALEFAASVTVPDQARSTLGDILEVVMPPHMRLEFCVKCVEGFVPMLEMLTGQAYDRTVERMKQQAAKNSKRKVGKNIWTDEE